MKDRPIKRAEKPREIAVKHQDSRKRLYKKQWTLHFLKKSNLEEARIIQRYNPLRKFLKKIKSDYKKKMRRKYRKKRRRN